MEDEKFCEQLGRIQAKIAVIDCKIEKHKANVGKFTDEYTEKELAELFKQRLLLRIETEKLWDTRREFPFNISKPKQ